MSLVPATPTLPVRDGELAGRLTGVSLRVGGKLSRSARYEWRVPGRLTARGAPVATISGTARIRDGARVFSRRKIARPVTATLARAS